MFWKLFNRGAAAQKSSSPAATAQNDAPVLSQAAQEQSDPSVNAHKSDGSEALDINRVAQFTFGGHVPVGQDIMLGDCSTTSTDVLKPCEWRVGPSEAKGIAKYRIFF